MGETINRGQNYNRLSIFFIIVIISCAIKLGILAWESVVIDWNQPLVFATLLASFFRYGGGVVIHRPNRAGNASLTSLSYA